MCSKLIQCNLSGWKDRMRLWQKKLSKASRIEMEKEPAMKEFKQVNENLKVL